MVWILIIVHSGHVSMYKGLYCTKRSHCTMRPEISDENIDRLREWAKKHGNVNSWREKMGHRGGNPVYTVDDALGDLLKEVGF